MIKTEILNNQQIAPDVYILSIPRVIKFQPGQVIRLVFNGTQPRLYSIASGNKESELKILYDVKPDGLVSPLIKTLRKGDPVAISEAFGKFRDNEDPAFWIANGTGIAPFYSMFKSGSGTYKTLIHGGREKDSFYFQDEFQPFFKEKYVRCCTLERGEGLYYGRLTEYLKEQKFLPPSQKYYLCGSTEMIVETRDILISKNIPFSNIIAEIYF